MSPRTLKSLLVAQQDPSRPKMAALETFPVDIRASICASHPDMVGVRGTHYLWTRFLPRSAFLGVSEPASQREAEDLPFSFTVFGLRLEKSSTTEPGNVTLVKQSTNAWVKVGIFAFVRNF